MEDEDTKNKHKPAIKYLNDENKIAKDLKDIFSSKK